MKPKLALVLLVAAVVTEGSRPPWYKPCWIYLCSLDLTDPVCAWDSRHGARLFRNDCEMKRHNFCYNRNYAVVDGDNNVAEDMKMCARLKTIVENAEDGNPPTVVEEGNVRVHFLEDPIGRVQRYRPDTLDPESRHVASESLEDRGGRLRARPWDRYPFKQSRLNKRYEDSVSSQEDAPFVS